MVASARIRLFVVKNDDGFEELNHETFDNRLVSFKTMRTQSSNNTLNDLLEMESEDFNFAGRRNCPGGLWKDGRCEGKCQRRS